MTKDYHRFCQNVRLYGNEYAVVVATIAFSDATTTNRIRGLPGVDVKSYEEQEGSLVIDVEAHVQVWFTQAPSRPSHFDPPLWHCDRLLLPRR